MHGVSSKEVMECLAKNPTQKRRPSDDGFLDQKRVKQSSSS